MITIRDLSYRYSQSPEFALERITLELEESRITAIMGANGSGKSTLARCLNGLLIPSAGNVLVDGMDTSVGAHIGAIRQRVGMIFQDPNLQITSVTVERELAFGLENVGMEAGEMRRRVDHQLELYGLEKYRHVSPTSLSGGEKQILAIASVLLLQPRYLVLDEATSLLSAASRTKVLDRVMGMRKGKQIGIILITQFPSEALLADRLIVLHAGHVVFDARPMDVFAHDEELRRLGVSVPLHSSLGRLYELPARQH
jgi:energy-coupling factor transport system ATP-binding protein